MHKKLCISQNANLLFHNLIFHIISYLIFHNALQVVDSVFIIQCILFLLLRYWRNRICIQRLLGEQRVR